MKHRKQRNILKDTISVHLAKSRSWKLYGTNIVFKKKIIKGKKEMEGGPIEA